MLEKNAVFTMPFLVTRKEWGALPPKKIDKAQVPSGIVLHHSATPTITQWKGRETLRAIQRVHQEERGFFDIGYHFVIAPDGTLYEGVNPVIRGTHCGGNPEAAGAVRIVGNTGQIGICVIGNFDSEKVPVPAWNTLIALIDALKAKYNIEASAVRGHFEVWSKPPKTCPGVNLVEMMGWGERWKKAYRKK